MPNFRGFETTIADGTIECLENGSDKIRFEDCFAKSHQVQYTRSVQGHSGGTRIGPKLQNNVQILHGWTTIHHVGSTYSKEVSLQVKSEFDREEKLASSQPWIPCMHQCLLFDANRRHSLNFDMKTNAQSKLLV